MYSYINIHKIKNVIFRIWAGDNIFALTARGGLLIGFGTAVENILRFIRNLILTRLLVPEAFGIMALIMALNSLLEAFTQIGTNLAIIQNNKGRDSVFLNCAWWISVTRAIMLYALAFIAAPWVASFFDNPNIISLMRIAFLNILFMGAISPRAHVAVKDMNYDKWAFITNGGSIVGILVTVILAFIIENVWALVFGLLSEAIMQLLFSYIILPFKPSLHMHKDSKRALFKYARGMFGLPLMTFIFNRADTFVIGKLATISDLGLYTMAVTLALIPAEFLTTLMNQLLMPYLSRIQDNHKEINKAIIFITQVLLLGFFPIVIWGIFYGADILSVVYGAEYAKAAIPFAIILGSVLFRLASAPIIVLYFAIGHPEINRIFLSMRAIMLIIMLYPAVLYYGMIGAASAILLAITLSFALQIYQIHKLVQIDLKKYVASFCMGFVISLSVPVIWYITKCINMKPFSNVALGALGCIVSYVFAAILLYRTWRYELLLIRE